MNIENGMSDLDASTSRVFQSCAVAACLFALVAWNYPRHLIHSETTIATKTPPFQKTNSGDVILDFELHHPLVDPPTIPSALLMWTSVWLPLMLVSLHAASSERRRRFERALTAFSGFATAIGLSEGTTVLLKLWIQRPRPNFYSLCGFDMTTLKCTADLQHIREANFSYPSGHSSLCASGMTFVVWYFLGHYSNKKERHPLSYALNVLLPVGWAIFVSNSRIADKWHHPSDVFAGLSIGFLMATIGYHVWFRSIWSAQAGFPRLMSRMDSSMDSNKLPSFHD